MSCNCKYPKAVELRIQAMHFAVQTHPGASFAVDNPNAPSADVVEQAKRIETYLKGDAELVDSKEATASDRAALVSALIARCNMPVDVQRIMADWVQKG